MNYFEHDLSTHLLSNYHYLLFKFSLIMLNCCCANFVIVVCILLCIGLCNLDTYAVVVNYFGGK